MRNKKIPNELESVPDTERRLIFFTAFTNHKFDPDKYLYKPKNPFSLYELTSESKPYFPEWGKISPEGGEGGFISLLSFERGDFAKFFRELKRDKPIECNTIMIDAGFGSSPGYVWSPALLNFEGKRASLITRGKIFIENDNRYVLSKKEPFVSCLHLCLVGDSEKAREALSNLQKDIYDTMDAQVKNGSTGHKLRVNFSISRGYRGYESYENFLEKAAK